MIKKKKKGFLDESDNKDDKKKKKRFLDDSDDEKQKEGFLDDSDNDSDNEFDTDLDEKTLNKWKPLLYDGTITMTELKEYIKNEENNWKPLMSDSQPDTPYYKLIDKDKDIDINAYCNINKLEEDINNIKKFEEKHEYDKVYVIGDIHGDFNALLQILININCITINKKPDGTTEYNWDEEAENVCIIQTGDIMDGYRDRIYSNGEQLKENGNADEQIYGQSNIRPEYISKDLEIIEFLITLKKEANKYDSNIILLYGNHEIMNIFNIIDLYKLRLYGYTVNNINLLNFKKIDSLSKTSTKKLSGSLEFKPLIDKSINKKNIEKECNSAFNCNCNNEVGTGFHLFRYSIKNTEPLDNIIRRIEKLKQLKQNILCNYKTYIIINNYLFCHSGFVSSYANNLLHLIKKQYPDINNNPEDYYNYLIKDGKDSHKKIDLINKFVTKILYCLYDVYSDNIDRYKGESGKVLNKDIQLYKNFIYNLVWNSEYQSINDKYKNEEELNKCIKDIIYYLGVKGIIIGHHACDCIEQFKNIIYDIDNSMSESFNGVYKLYGSKYAGIKSNYGYLKIENGEVKILYADNYNKNKIKEDYKKLGISERNIEFKQCK